MKCSVSSETLDKIKKQSIISTSIAMVFDGNCREAMEFYQRVFKAENKHILTMGELSNNSSDSISENDKNKVANGTMTIGNLEINFFDNFMPESQHITGNNIIMHMWIEGKDETHRIFNELKDGGTVHEELKEQFYADLNGIVTDKFGVKWNLLCHVPK